MPATFIAAWVVSLMTHDLEAQAKFDTELVRTDLGVGAEKAAPDSHISRGTTGRLRAPCRCFFQPRDIGSKCSATVRLRESQGNGVDCALCRPERSEGPLRLAQLTSSGDGQRLRGARVQAGEVLRFAQDDKRAFVAGGEKPRARRIAPRQPAIVFLSPLVHHLSSIASRLTRPRQAGFCLL